MFQCQSIEQNSMHITYNTHAAKILTTKLLTLSTPCILNIIRRAQWWVTHFRHKNAWRKRSTELCHNIPLHGRQYYYYFGFLINQPKFLGHYIWDQVIRKSYMVGDLFYNQSTARFMLQIQQISRSISVPHSTFTRPSTRSRSWTAWANVSWRKLQKMLRKRRCVTAASRCAAVTTSSAPPLPASTDRGRNPYTTGVQPGSRCRHESRLWYSRFFVSSACACMHNDHDNCLLQYYLEFAYIYTP